MSQAGAHDDFAYQAGPFSNQSSLPSSVHLFGIFDLTRTESGYSLIKFAQPVFVMQLRILRKGLKVDLRDRVHTSATQSEEIADLVFFGSNLRKPKAARFEMICRISPLEKLISKDCIVPVQSPVSSPDKFLTDSLIVLGSFESLTLAVYGTKVQVAANYQKPERFRHDLDLHSLKSHLDAKRLQPKVGGKDLFSSSAMSLENIAPSGSSLPRKDKVFAVEKKLSEIFSLNSAFKDGRDKIVGSLSKLSKIRSQPRPTENDAVKSQASKVTDCYNDLINGLNLLFEECGAKFSGHWRIILDMLHDQLKASGFLNLISSFSKTQPVLELVWSLIKRSPDLSSSVGLGDASFTEHWIARLADSRSLVEVTAALTLAMWNCRKLKTLHEDGSPVDFIVSLPASLLQVSSKEARKRSRSSSKQSEHRKSDKKKKKGKGSASRSRSGSRKGHKKEKKDRRDGHSDKEISKESQLRSKKAMNVNSLLLSKLLEFPELASSHIFNVVLNYHTLEVFLRRPMDSKDSKSLRLDYALQLDRHERTLKFFHLINTPQQIENLTPFEKFCLNIIMISIPESPLMALVMGEFNDLQVQLATSKFRSSKLQVLSPEDKGYEVVSLVATMIHKGTFKKFFLGAIKTFEELNNLMDSYSPAELPLVIENFINSGWLDVLCLEVLMLNRTRKLELEEIRVLEAIFANMSFVSHRSLEKLYSLIEQLQKEEIMMSFSPFNHKDSQAFVDAVCKALNHKPKLYPSKKDSENERELEYIQTVAESRILTRKRFSGSPIDINLSSLLLLLNHAVIKIETGSLKFAELTFENMFDSVYKAIDVMLDLFWVCRYPETTNFEQNTKADLNPGVYLQISLRCLQLAVFLYRQKLEFINSSRSSPREFLNVDLITLCALIYSTDLERQSDFDLVNLKNDINSNIERILHAAGRFVPESSSPADRVLNKLIELAITSTSNAKVLKLLLIYVSACPKTQQNQAFADTLLKQPNTKSISLRNYCSERSLLYLFDYMLDNVDKSALHRLVTHVVQIPDPASQFHLKQLFNQLLNSDWKIHEGIYKLAEDIARNLAVKEGPVLKRGLTGTAKNNFFGILLILAQNPVWKGIAIEGDLGDVLLADAESSLKDGWFLELDISSAADHLSFFMKLAAILVNRDYGMSSVLADVKEAKDGTKLEYLFEDLPKESLIQDMVKKLDGIVQPLVDYLGKNPTTEQRDTLEKILVNWTSFLQAMSQSTICQIMLLYTLYTKQARSIANPLTLLDKLTQVLLASGTETSCEALVNILSTVSNLLASPSTGKPLKSKRRLAAIEKFVGGDVSTLLSRIADHVSQSSPDSRWAILAKLLVESIENDVQQCSSAYDKDENESYANSRDFKERLRKFLKIKEDKEKDSLKKYAKKRVSALDFNPAYQSIIYQFNEKTTDEFLAEDARSRLWHEVFLEEIQENNRVSLDQSFGETARDKECNIEFEVKPAKDDAMSTSAEPQAQANFNFTVFKEVIFQNTHRLVESKTYAPSMDYPRPGLTSTLSGQNYLPNAPLSARASSTRAASTHVDEFKGVSNQGISPFSDKQVAPPPLIRPEIPPPARPVPVPSSYQPSLPQLTPAVSAYEPHAVTPIVPFMTAPQTFASQMPDYNPFPAQQPPAKPADISKGEVQTLLGMLKNKFSQRRPPNA